MKPNSSWISVLPSLLIPVCMGMMMYVGLQAIIDHEVLTNETILRYLTGHPVSRISVAMFFIGLASLMMIGQNVLEQFGATKRIRIQSDSPGEVSGAGSLAVSNGEGGVTEQLIQKAARFADGMLEFPRWMHDHYLWQRVVNALHSIHRNGTTANIDDELKYAAETDIDRQQQRYSLVRILIWATPMLGFLGTVLGISQALGGINVGPDNDFQGMMNGLRGSLYVAFDTTALALTLSMVLMFGQFLIDRFESQLLEVVDQRARDEIACHFNLATHNSLSIGDKINREVFTAMNQAVGAQTEIWRKTIAAAEAAWESTLGDVGNQVQQQLQTAFDESAKGFADCIGNAIHTADESMQHRWEQWQVLLSENARQLAGSQTQLADQTGKMQELLEKYCELQQRETEQAESDKDQHHDMIAEQDLFVFEPSAGEATDEPLENLGSDLDYHELDASGPILLPIRQPEVAVTPRRTERSSRSSEKGKQQTTSERVPAVIFPDTDDLAATVHPHVRRKSA